MSNKLKLIIVSNLMIMGFNVGLPANAARLAGSGTSMFDSGLEIEGYGVPEYNPFPEASPGLDKPATPSGLPPDISTPTQGTTSFKTMGSTCKTITPTSTDWIDIFGGDINITTGAGSSLINISFQSQATISQPGTPDTTISRLYFRCIASADNFNTFTPCSGQSITSPGDALDKINGVIFVRRDLSNGLYYSTTNSTNYNGYVSNVLPGTAYKIRLQARNQNATAASPTPTNSSICYGNLKLSY